MNASDLTAEYAEGSEENPESGGRMVPEITAIFTTEDTGIGQIQ
jgi:hypothetical protein